MINLIPNEKKKEMKKIFYYRILVLFLFMLGFCIFVFFIALLPSYVTSYTKLNLANLLLEQQKNEAIPLPDQQTLESITDLDKKLTLLESAEQDNFIFSEKVIDNVLLKKAPAIKITQISYEGDGAGGQKILMGGTAPSREMLLSLRRSLETDPSFKSADLPISNFVQGSNIRFFLTLIP